MTMNASNLGSTTFHERAHHCRSAAAFFDFLPMRPVRPIAQNEAASAAAIMRSTYGPTMSENSHQSNGAGGGADGGGGPPGGALGGGCGASGGGGQLSSWTTPSARICTAESSA